VGFGRPPRLMQVLWGQMGGYDAMTLDTRNLPTHKHDATFAGSGAISGKATATATMAASTTPTGSDPNSSYVSTIKQGLSNLNSFGSSANASLAGDAVAVDVNTSNLGVDMSQASVEIGNTGGGQPFDNRQPYLGMNYVMCLVGIFPPRN